MHHRLEVVMPPTENVEKDLEGILSQYNENGQDEDGEGTRHAFWDWYVIGGRFAGAKLKESLAGERFDEFKAELDRMELTVSNLQCGKPELNPASQIETVDALWNKMFPDSPLKTCPLFAHSNNHYEHSLGYPDVMRLQDVPGNCTAERMIFVGPHWEKSGELEVGYMVQESFWNGTNHQDTAWDGTLKGAIEGYNARLDGMAEEYAAKMRPQPDWLVVTVDYHG